MGSIALCVLWVFTGILFVSDGVKCIEDYTVSGVILILIGALCFGGAIFCLYKAYEERHPEIAAQNYTVKKKKMETPPKKYFIELNDGSPRTEYVGTMVQAAVAANFKMTETEKDVELYDENGVLVAKSRWVAGSPPDGTTPVATFNKGFYSHWVRVKPKITDTK